LDVAHGYAFKNGIADIIGKSRRMRWERLLIGPSALGLLLHFGNDLYDMQVRPGNEKGRLRAPSS
jgi:hypothetical protein